MTAGARWRMKARLKVRMLRFSTHLFPVVLVLLFPGSCGLDSPARIDCNAICGRYQTCFDDGYDVDRCAQECEDDADRDPEFDDKVAHCAQCIEGRSCAGTPFGCGTECLGIVP